jgi:hypothetical protein
MLRLKRGIRVYRNWVCAALALLGGAGCDSLLDVSRPGKLEERDLDDPRLAPLLVLGAQADFECMLGSYIWATSLWTRELHASTTDREVIVYALRSPDVIELGGIPCDSADSPGLWLPLNVARVQAESAIRRIESFPSEQVPDRALLLAQASAYAAYSYLLAGEAFCELAFDAGPLLTREAAWRLAEERFTESLRHAELALKGQRAGDARGLLSLALVGRARSRLNLGNTEGVVEDAQRVDEGFVYLATNSAGHPRRYNRIFDRVNRVRHSSVAEPYRALKVEGVADPRVPVAFHGVGTGRDGRTEIWIQLKYASLGEGIPFASWREAQLMMAEVNGGAVALSILNRLRATHELPAVASTDPLTIRGLVREDRRRELWLQGTRIGDKLRWEEPWTTGSSPTGEPYSSLTCIPLPAREWKNNPNL